MKFELESVAAENLAILGASKLIEVSRLDWTRCSLARPNVKRYSKGVSVSAHEPWSVPLAQLPTHCWGVLDSSWMSAVGWRIINRRSARCSSIRWREATM